MDSTLVLTAAAVVVVAMLLTSLRRRRRARFVPDELRPVILEEALRRARAKQAQTERERDQYSRGNRAS